jgi:hypothetical protein
MSSPELLHRIRKFWGIEGFRKAVEHRIQRGKGLQKAGALIIKEIASEMEE